MATESQPTSAMFRALRSVNVEPELAQQAVEENRNEAGQNVIAAIGAQIADLRAEMVTGFERINTRFEQVNTRFEQVNTRFAEVNGRIDSLQGKVETVTRIAWPLVVGILVVVVGNSSVFLYKVFWP